MVRVICDHIYVYCNYVTMDTILVFGLLVDTNLLLQFSNSNAFNFCLKTLHFCQNKKNVNNSRKPNPTKTQTYSGLGRNLVKHRAFYMKFQ